MLKRFIIALTAICFVLPYAFAAEDGLYIGAQAGRGVTKHDAGLAARFYLGYQINKYFATELGFTDYPSAEQNNSYFLNTLPHTDEYSKQTLDFVGKAMLPVTKNFNLYAKGGFAAVHDTHEITYTDGTNDEKSSTNGRLVYGFGMSYDINKNFSADLSWTQQPGVFSGNSTFTGLGISYHFD